MPDYENDVVIDDGCHTYFRPSLYKMERDIEYEVKDYTSKKISSKSSMFTDNKSLCLVDHPYDRLCYVRKRYAKLKCSSTNENKTDIMVLLGVEHKLVTQLNQAKEFHAYYTQLFQNVEKQLSKFKYRLASFFRIQSVIEKKILPLLKNKQLHEQRIVKFEYEIKEVQDMIQFIRGKILYLADESISQLGLIKE